MMHQSTVGLFLLLATVCAQGVPPVPGAPSLPAANSAEATALLDKALAKVQALGCGSFSTNELQDSAMVRGKQPWGNWGIETDGGWSQDLSWSRAYTDSLVQCGSRVLVMTTRGWKLRRRTLPSGSVLPFAIDPSLLFRVLGDLPRAERQVRHVGAGKVGRKSVAILSITLEGEVASDFIESGVVPGVRGYSSSFVVPGLVPGVPPEHRVHLAFFVDPEGGDLLRFAARTVEDISNLQGWKRLVTEVAEVGDEEKGIDEEPAPAAGAPTFTDGFPSRPPTKAESVMTYTVDFRNVGFVDVPPLDDKAKALLRLVN
jgi:hypothetical protein